MTPATTSPVLPSGTLKVPKATPVSSLDNGIPILEDNIMIVTWDAELQQNHLYHHHHRHYNGSRGTSQRTERNHHQAGQKWQYQNPITRFGFLTKPDDEEHKKVMAKTRRDMIEVNHFTKKRLIEASAVTYIFDNTCCGQNRSENRIESYWSKIDAEASYDEMEYSWESNCKVSECDRMYD